METYGVKQKQIEIIGQSFWQKNRFITHKLFELCLFFIFSPFANFGKQSLCQYYLPTYSLPGTKFQTAFNQALGTS